MAAAIAAGQLMLGRVGALITPMQVVSIGRVKRIDGRVSDVLATTHFRSRDGLKATLERYEKLRNDQMPQRALAYRTPLQAIRARQSKLPEPFNTEGNNKAGRDT